MFQKSIDAHRRQKSNGFYQCPMGSNQKHLERLKQDTVLTEKTAKEYCMHIRGEKMGLFHKIGYILEVAAFCMHVTRLKFKRRPSIWLACIERWKTDFI